MESNKFYLHNLWLWKCGLPEIEEGSKEVIDINELYLTEWSLEFEKLMQNRLVMGGLRYGKMGHGSIPKGKPAYDRVGSIKKRLGFFEETGNSEWLVDVANMCLLIFEERQHENFHFDSKDDLYHDKTIK
jgi:hypothetical protein